jgi:peptide chain release factor 1
VDAKLSVRLAALEAAFEDLERSMVDPALLADRDRYTEAARRHSELAPIVDTFRRCRSAEAEQAEAAELAGADPSMAVELRELAAEKASEAERLEKELRLSLIPRDPNDDRDVIVEIRGAAGGDEAAIWAGDLARMYQRYAERLRLSVEAMDSNESEAGGFKEVVFAVKGRGAYSKMKYEGGVHRVQRVPKTEASGRVHTSTATVAVLPEVAEVDIDINPADVKVDVYRSSGPGGQSVNTTDSAVRLTHLPTGVVVTCQDERSQLQNREKAWRRLRAVLYQYKRQEQQAAVAGSRRDQVGTGERSEKIRTYNYKESRVTDHRIGLTIKRLPEVLAGDLDELVTALAADDQARRLAEG